MTAPTKWRDALGRQWVQSGVLGGFYCRDINYISERPVVQALCGPLVPVEPMARVRVPGLGFLRETSGAPVEQPAVHLSWNGIGLASTFPLARAEEIAAAFRVLGYTDATVEVV